MVEVKTIKVMKKPINEDYVSFETAKLMVKNGLGYSDCYYDSYYTLGGEVVYLKDKPSVLNVAPRLTLTVAMRWLREVHNLDICVFPERHDYILWGYSASIYKNKTSLCTAENYRVYEEAAEAAIKYCVENLI